MFVKNIKNMNILLIGSGGREHALAWKMAQSKKLDKLYIAPGNAGTSSFGQNVDIRAEDFEKTGQFCIENNIDMVVVGPEVPLVKGIHDYFLETPALKKIAVIGPQKAGAMLEGSKHFAKQFMFRHQIPTARYHSVNRDTLEDGFKFLEQLSPPYVLKADGLAAGKGVLIINTVEEAKSELLAMLIGKFGSAGNTVVIEEFLSGIELSVFIITDDESYKILPDAKDYKKIGKGDTGLNTGGMGAVSPVPFVSKEFLRKIEDRIIRPTFEGLKKENIPYKGFLYFGLINCKGDPYVIEYNAGMGDPEAEVVLPRISSDIIELFEGVATGTLASKHVDIIPNTATTVMLVSGGYPGSYEKEKVIENLDKTEDCIVFHAGTKLADGKVLTNGGRVISLTAYGKDFKEALVSCYSNAEIVQFDKMYYRPDIGFDL